MSSPLIKPQTVAQIVDAYLSAKDKIDRAYRLLKEAQEELQAVMSYPASYSIRFNTLPEHGYRYSEHTVEDVQKRIKKNVWEYLIKLSGIYKLLTIARRNELDKNLEEGKMPDITVEEILDMFIVLQQNSRDIQNEAVMEAYDILRPRHSRLKTNQIEGIHAKVILSYKIERGYNEGKFRVRYHSTQAINIIDRAFHILDGKPIPDGYNNFPLVDAINTSPTGIGETEYFKFKAYKNGNLHLSYKRPDLVEKFNRVAGEAILATETK
jgi:hypothetical protein